MGKKNKEPTNKEKRKESNSQVTTTIITTLGIVIVALLAFPPFLRLFEPKSTPTPTFLSTIEPYITITPFSTSTMIAIEPTPIESAIASPIPTTVSSPEVSGIMYVVLNANQTKGRRPLEVIFDARDSYFIAADGTLFECGACTFTWRIRESGQEIYGPENTEGRLNYTFGGQGTYYVTVYVCRTGSDTECSAGVSVIEVE